MLWTFALYKIYGEIPKTAQITINEFNNNIYIIKNEYKDKLSIIL